MKDLIQVSDKTLDGRKVTNIYSWSDPNILTEFVIGKKVNSTVLRRFYPQGIDLWMEANGVNATSVFSRSSFDE